MKIARLAAIALAAPLLLTAADARAELVGRWQFDGNLNDSVNGNHAVAIGNAAAGTSNGVVGGAASFDGVDDAMRIAGVFNLVGPQMSISFWEFSPGTSNAGYFLASGTDAPGFEQIFMRRDAADVDDYNGGINLADGAAAHLEFKNTTDVARGAWHHNLIVADATGSGVTGAWYVDGVLFQPGTGGSGSTADLLLTDLYLGNRKDLARDFLGLLDDVQVYNHALTASNAAFLFANPGLAVVPTPSAAAAGLALLAPLALRRRRG